MQTLLQDLRYGLRMLLKKPGFALVAVSTLALGIGANTAIFSVVNGVLLRSLPYREPERLMVLNNAFISMLNLSSPQSALNWRENTQSFEEVAAYGDFDGGVNLTDEGEAARIEATEVSANFFAILGIGAVLGRVFTSEHERPENLGEMLISADLWQQRFAGKPDIIGQEMRLNGQRFTIIGVVPAEFQFPHKSDVWVPLRLSLEERIFTSATIGYRVFARLKNGVTLQQARAEMQALSEELKLRETVGVTPLLDSIVGKYRSQMQILLVAVGFVLLIACANVANLLLARGAARRREMAVRAALGARRWTLLRQSLTEALLIAALGGAAGLLLAIWLRDLLLALSPSEIPRLDEVSLDLRVLGFNFALALLTGLLVGFLPALQASKVDLMDALKDGSQSISGGSGRRLFSLKGALVAGEIALSVVLLIGAGLLIRSLANVLRLDPGFDRENILTVSLTLPSRNYAERRKIANFYQELLERVQNIPGVVAVGTTNKMPLSRENVFGLLFEVVGRPQQEAFQERFATFLSVSPDYFRALGIPLLQGRTFTASDTDKSPPVVIINDRMAKTFFPDGDALGQQIKLPNAKTGRAIVGIVSAVRGLSLEDDPQKEMYLPFPQGGNPPTALAIRTVGNPLSVVGAVREAARDLDKDLPLYDVKTVSQRVSEAVAKRRFSVTLMSSFAMLAMLLAAIGIYGVVTYSVAQRTREIGVRMALGAQARDVLNLIVKQGMTLAVIGVLIGSGGAFALTRLMTSLLFGVAATDAVTFAVIALLLTLVAWLACYIPARRASKVDPMVALRYE